VSATTSPTAPDYLRQFEARIIGLSRKGRDNFVLSYFDWLNGEAANLVKLPINSKLEAMKDLSALFVTGSKQPDQQTIEKFWETLAVVFYSIGDSSFDSPITRLRRAIERRIKLYNVIMTLLGLPHVAIPEKEMSYGAEDLEYAIAYLKAEIVLFEEELEKLKGSPENPIKDLENVEPEV